MRENRLYYTAPAAEWTEALPMGNGALGMMVFGGIPQERLQLNEETFWSGFPCPEYNSPETLPHLGEIRSLIFSGRYAEAEAMSKQYLTCAGQGHRDKTGGFGSYQTAGDLYITLGEGEGRDYRRTLYLDSGRAEVLSDGIRRDYTVSPTYEAGAVRMTGLSSPATVRYEREAAAIFPREGEILAIGRLPLAYAVLIRYRQEGDTLTLFFTAATAYGTERDPQEVCRERLDAAEAAGYTALSEDAAAYFGERLGRVEITLPEGRHDLPTDVRLASPRGDEGLLELYFNFGRYLLLASSRDKLPANLQGIWCHEYLPPWSADYHININIQMNYWLAELADLPETLAPFFSYVKMLAKAGEETARVVYGCPGWVAHHQTNPWGYTSLGCNPLYGAFVTAGAWCLYHVRERYLFGRDPEILREFLPVIRGAVEFFSAYLVTDPRTGHLVTVPASSPENSFLAPGTDERVSLSAGPTMDNSILRGLMTEYLEALEVLGIEDDPLCDRAREILASLPPLRIGRHGTIMEWAEDFREAEPGHRHISQLYALYPAAEITRNDPLLFEAARKTIERRLANGGGHTGWSRAWIVNFFARLLDGEAAHENLVKLLENSTLKNMFDNHPPFQIDGNFGGAAGIAEMLLGSHDGAITLLPALPAAWQNGAFRGLRARGGFSVSARFEAGRVVACRITGAPGACGRVRIGEEEYSFTGEFTLGEGI